MLKKYKIVLPFFVLLLILSACGDEYEGDFSYEVQDFSYTNQDGEEVSKSELDGNFWVANFIFTNCETVCPPMTSNMAKLQTQLDEAGLDDVRLVSFSVDPENDTPEALKEYGESRNASFDNWDFLTGYEFDEIKKFSINSFKSPLELLPDSDQVMHVTSFFLVSPEGNAIKRYTGTMAAEMEKIVQDLNRYN
ncbi:cytochrome c oxidase assembly protein [Virgibacillus profundi]|uniref:Cytochrome c oxidase assembly protein n=1 Tax=Virgibacillus profundi TaxID=2024555 RepID=A0A2A2IAM1_9BACI|nr:SCO family protein [Virgibacillus profundi]PAV28779.1 cytochrome c oxidase assembly protein [Virgibacillus profundi]PXY52947.1 SCO family protein [Virgibacillus profundi]